MAVVNKHSFFDGIVDETNQEYAPIEGTKKIILILLERLVDKVKVHLGEFFEEEEIYKQYADIRWHAASILHALSLFSDYTKPNLAKILIDHVDRVLKATSPSNTVTESQPLVVASSYSHDQNGSSQYPENVGSPEPKIPDYSKGASSRLPSSTYNNIKQEFNREPSSKPLSPPSISSIGLYGSNTSNSTLVPNPINRRVSPSVSGSFRGTHLSLAGGALSRSSRDQASWDSDSPQSLPAGLNLNSQNQNDNFRSHNVQAAFASNHLNKGKRQVEYASQPVVPCKDNRGESSTELTKSEKINLKFWSISFNDLKYPSDNNLKSDTSKKRRCLPHVTGLNTDKELDDFLQCGESSIGVDQGAHSSSQSVVTISEQVFDTTAGENNQLLEPPPAESNNHFQGLESLKYIADPTDQLMPDSGVGSMTD